jgi:hypothetical protein
MPSCSVPPKPVVARLWDRSLEPQNAHLCGNRQTDLLIGLVVIVRDTAAARHAGLGHRDGSGSYRIGGVIKSVVDFENLARSACHGRAVASPAIHKSWRQYWCCWAPVAIGSWAAVSGGGPSLRALGIWRRRRPPRQYGDPYRQYLQRVPRWLVLF